MPHRFPPSARGLAVALVLAACSHASPDPAAGPTRVRTEPPHLLGQTHPDIMGEISANYEVAVDAEGRADVGTLKITGSVTDPERDAIARWLAGSRFTPARQNGQPVPGVYKGGLKTKVRQVRM